MNKWTIIASLLLSGCAVFDSPPGTQIPTTWVKVAEPLPYVWVQSSISHVKAFCGFRFATERMACAWRRANDCLIYSPISESEAAGTYLRSPTGAVRTLDKKPETLRDHEVKHCAGYNHESMK
jgi:hypothetical protein